VPVVAQPDVVAALVSEEVPEDVFRLLVVVDHARAGGGVDGDAAVVIATR
jgi:hypothetical protein